MANIMFGFLPIGLLVTTGIEYIAIYVTDHELIPASNTTDSLSKDIVTDLWASS